MKRKVLMILIILFPYLDLTTSLITRNYNCSLTPGIIIKGIFMLLMLFYIFISKSKYKKTSIICLILFLLYVVGYFSFKPELLNGLYFASEIIYLFKLFYFPVVFLGLLCFYDDEKFDKEEIIYILKVNLISFTILLIVPLLFNKAYTTYPSILKGYIGWFFAGNEIANIMVILLPFMYYFIRDKKYSFLISLPIIYVILQIGTKVSLLGLIIVTILTFVYYLFKYRTFKNKETLVSLGILIITIVFSINSYAVQNYKYSLHNKYERPETIVIDINKEKEVNDISNQINDFYNKNKFNKLFKTLLNGRDIYLANTLSIYNDNLKDSDILFGIAFSNTKKVDNTNITKLIEIDVLDAYFHYGIFGLLIMLSPFLIVIYFLIIGKGRLNLKSYYYILILLLMLGISCLSGHTLMSPAVSIYIILYLLLLMDENGLIGREYILEDEVSILSLHMGYGGIEKSIINQANIISEFKKCEIICLYNIGIKMPYKLNENVKMIYLSDTKPNKIEFMDYYHHHKYIKMIKEGFKSLRILYLKHYLIKKYIYNSKSKYIISTRLEFTKLLNRYGYNDTIKIAEEHVHHQNNKKYINILKKSLKNINYLIPASNYLTKDYKKYFKDIKTKIIYIPQTLDYIPKKPNKLNNFNLLAVGRLSKEKGYTDLIEIMKLIVKKNRNIKLTIAGDGAEKSRLLFLTKEYKLNNNIKFTGFINQEDLQKEYKKASLFLMTSLEESFGLVLIEAMSYGIPSLAFDDALGAKEIIINNETGYLIKNRNKNEYAKKVLSLLNTEKINKLGLKAYNESLKYTAENVSKDWQKLLGGK